MTDRSVHRLPHSEAAQDPAAPRRGRHRIPLSNRLGQKTPVNWKLLGMTTGRGKDSTSKRPNRSLKEVLGYPLTPHFRDLLSQV